jgi:hypothetical protein
MANEIGLAEASKRLEYLEGRVRVRVVVKIG